MQRAVDELKKTNERVVRIENDVLSIRDFCVVLGLASIIAFLFFLISLLILRDIKLLYGEIIGYLIAMIFSILFFFYHNKNRE